MSTLQQSVVAQPRSVVHAERQGADRSACGCQAEGQWTLTMFKRSVVSRYGAKHMQRCAEHIYSRAYPGWSDKKVITLCNMTMLCASKLMGMHAEERYAEQRHADGGGETWKGEACRGEICITDINVAYQ